MKHEILLYGALANCSGGASSEDLLHFLKERTESVDYYRLALPPGTHTNAAFDWQAILGVTASTIAIAQALWAAYKKFIKPQKEKGNDSSFLLVAMKNEKREFVQFAVGKDDLTEEEFVREFSEKVEKIRYQTDDRELQVERTEIRESTYWKKI